MELMRLQRKLIPINIVVMVLALIAAASLFFLPLISVDFSNDPQAIMGLMGENQGGEESEEAEESGSDETNVWMEGLSALHFSITTYDFVKLATADDPVALFSSAVANIIEDVADKIAVTAIAMGALEAMGEEIDQSNVETKLLFEKLVALETADPETEAPEIIADFSQMLAQQLNLADDPDFISATYDYLSSLYYDTIEYSGTAYSVESTICIVVSMMSGLDEEQYVYTYEDLINHLITNFATGENGEAVDVAAMLSNAGLYLSVAFGFFVAIWLIQFLFAFFHLFAKNKRFMMWYTKLFGLTPCLLFFVLPTLAGMVLPMVLPEFALDFAFLGIVSSMTWISGVCYLLLWIISIFWAFPIKRKIRKLLRAGATY